MMSINRRSQAEDSGETRDSPQPARDGSAGHALDARTTRERPRLGTQPRGHDDFPTAGPLSLALACPADSFWERWCRNASPEQKQHILPAAIRSGVVQLHQLPVPGLQPSRNAVQTLIAAIVANRPPPSNPWSPACVAGRSTTTLDDDQRHAVAVALGSPDLSLIVGYPGSGKSRVVAEILRQAAAPVGAQSSSSPRRVPRWIGSSTVRTDLGPTSSAAPARARRCPPRSAALSLQERIRHFDEANAPRRPAAGRGSRASDLARLARPRTPGLVSAPSPPDSTRSPRGGPPWGGNATSLASVVGCRVGVRAATRRRPRSGPSRDGSTSRREREIEARLRQIDDRLRIRESETTRLGDERGPLTALAAARGQRPVVDLVVLEVAPAARPRPAPRGTRRPPGDPSRGTRLPGAGTGRPRGGPRRSAVEYAARGADLCRAEVQRREADIARELARGRPPRRPRWRPSGRRSCRRKSIPPRSKPPSEPGGPNTPPPRRNSRGGKRGSRPWSRPGRGWPSTSWSALASWPRRSPELLVAGGGSLAGGVRPARHRRRAPPRRKRPPRPRPARAALRPRRRTRRADPEVPRRPRPGRPTRRPPTSSSASGPPCTPTPSASRPVWTRKGDRLVARLQPVRPRGRSPDRPASRSSTVPKSNSPSAPRRGRAAHRRGRFPRLDGRRRREGFPLPRIGGSLDPARRPRLPLARGGGRRPSALRVVRHDAGDDRVRLEAGVVEHLGRRRVGRADDPAWHTLGLSFARADGWDRNSAATWVAERLGLRDLGRTACLSRVYRARPALASFLGELLFPRQPASCAAPSPATPPNSSPAASRGTGPRSTTAARPSVVPHERHDRARLSPRPTPPRGRLRGRSRRRPAARRHRPRVACRLAAARHREPPRGVPRRPDPRIPRGGLPLLRRRPATPSRTSPC